MHGAWRWVALWCIPIFAHVAADAATPGHYATGKGVQGAAAQVGVATPDALVQGATAQVVATPDTPVQGVAAQVGARPDTLVQGAAARLGARPDTLVQGAAARVGIATPDTPVQGAAAQVGVATPDTLVQGVAAQGAAAQGAAPPGVAAPSVALPSPLIPEKNLCATRAEPVALSSAQWNGWGRGLDNTRYQSEPGLRASDVAKLALKWSYGYQGGSGGDFGQPTVVDGRIFVGSSTGRIYALDAKTGCTYWTFDAAAGVRTTITIGELGHSRRAVAPKLPRGVKRTLAHLDVIKAPSAAYFADERGSAYALDAQHGTILWKTGVETHPATYLIAAPTLYDERLYVAVASLEDKIAAADAGYACCTFRGSVSALDMATGKSIWKTYTVLEEPTAHKNPGGVQGLGPAGAPVFGAPTIDPKRHLLYVGTGASFTSIEQALTDAVVALDVNDGKLRWVKQLMRPGEVASSGFMASPILRNLQNGVDVVVAGQKSGRLYALDPDHGGEILWQTRVAEPANAPAAGGIAWGPAADYRNVYAAATGALSQPGIAAGSLAAFDLKTGAPRWHSPAPQPACSPVLTECLHGHSQAVTLIPGVAFSGSLDGHLRAFSTIDGKIRWDVDTAKPYQTQNGMNVSGGALDHGGPTIVNGIVYVNSGNVLLAFSVDGK